MFSFETKPFTVQGRGSFELLKVYRGSSVNTPILFSNFCNSLLSLTFSKVPTIIKEKEDQNRLLYLESFLLRTIYFILLIF